MAIMDNLNLTEILAILLPFITIVAGGAVALWRYLQAQERQRRVDEAERDHRTSDHIEAVKDATWKRAQEMLDRQERRIDELERLFRECQEKLEKNGIT